jgi:hypothetical protein
MAAIDDILAAKFEALEILDEKIFYAKSLWEAGPPAMDAEMASVVARLMEHRTSVVLQNVSVELDAPTAARMPGIANIGEFGSAANRVRSALASSLPGDGTTQPIKRPT